jgi:glycerol-3-phosphate acyltransferase PlsX
MGGDHAPEQIVMGALEALPELHGKLFLVGRPEALIPYLGGAVPKGIEIVPASEVVEMYEPPMDAYRKKKDSSIMVGARLVKDGHAQAFVSAGNTGAASGTSLLMWRQVAGIHRPAIASRMPDRGEGWLLLDAGASPDVDASHLVEFAILGRAYAEKVMGRRNPKVQLINIGEEPSKGNALAKEAHKLLAKYPWFAGNVEGKDLWWGECDVVVCDAFVGNVILKTAEGVGEFIVKTVREGVPTGALAKLPYLPMRKVFAPIRHKMDYSEVGGSPLLGLNGLCTIAHGRSNAKAIKNALLQTQRAIESGLADAIRVSIAEAGLGDAESKAVLTE